MARFACATAWHEVTAERNNVWRAEAAAEATDTWAVWDA